MKISIKKSGVGLAISKRSHFSMAGDEQSRLLNQLERTSSQLSYIIRSMWSLSPFAGVRAVELAYEDSERG